MPALLYKSPRYTQGGVDITIDDGWMNFMKGSFYRNADFWQEVDKYLRRAMVLVANRAQANINAMQAVATGFMRAHIVTQVKIDMGSSTPLKAVLGTQAWYDILIEKGLGRHSPTGEMPAKYKPTAAQLAIVPSAAASKPYWKRSPKVPRPFLSNAVKQTRVAFKKLVMEGFKAGFRKLSVKNRSVPRHSLKALANISPNFT